MMGVLSQVSLSAMAVVTFTNISFAEITCLRCHADENIEQLIWEREIHPDFNQIDIPDWAKVSDLGGTITNTQTPGSSNAFSEPITNLSEFDLKKHISGDAFFEQAFVPAPNPDYTNFAGLGPVFNDNACETCHQKDGRFHLPPIKSDGQKVKLMDSGIFLRISIEDEGTYQGENGSVRRSADNLWGAPTAVPNFSDQLFHRSASRNQPVRAMFKDAQGNIDWQALQSGQADVWISIDDVRTVTYADGTQVTLTKPTLWVDNPYDAPDNGAVYDEIEISEDAKSRLFKPDVRFSPRIGMPVFGLGLLEAIKEEDILSQVNNDSRTNNGITGKANWVYDAQKHEECKVENNCESNPPVSLGRFGWKASTPSVRQQSLGALRGDIGITNSMFGKESIDGTDLWNAYLELNPEFKQHVDSNTQPESTKEFDDAVTFYSQTLAVPARINAGDKDVIKGAQLFTDANCIACHTPSYVTGNDHEIEQFRNQTIYPFSDMLLHDMGEDLADNRRDFEANGNEWKTRPLWGIGKTKTVNPTAGFLHDGRAKTLEEAILWHGGEGERSREYFRQLSKENRDLLIKFLLSL